MAKGEKQKKRVPLPLGEKCTTETLTIVDAFLRRNNLLKVSKALNRDLKKRKMQLLAKKDTPQLEQIISEWQDAKEDDDSSSDDSSDDDSSEDSDSSEESDSDESVAAETPAPKSLKRKAPSPSSSEPDSDSDSSDSEAEVKPILKKVKTAASTAVAAVSSATTALAKSVAPAVIKAEESDETSSDSDSSESEDEKPGLGAIPKISATPTAGGTAGANDDSDSSSDDSSDSDSDSSESDSEAEAAPQKKKKTVASKLNGHGKSKDQTPPSSVSTLSAEPSAAAQSKLESTSSDGAKNRKGQNVPFSRVPKNLAVPAPLSSNAYQFGGNNAYADRAHQDLIVTKGKSFTKEKNKKKRGSYRGGFIDTGPSKAIKFED